MVAPLPAKLDLITSSEEKINNAAPYRKLIDALMSLSTTVRPNNCCFVNYLARLMHKPAAKHRNAGKHLLRYLERTELLGMKSRAGRKDVASVYLDADWVQERPSRRSVSGFCVMVAGRMVRWRSRHQTVVAQSSKKAVFVALATCLRKALWFKKFETMFLKIMKKECTDQLFQVMIGEDNVASIKDASKPVASDLSRHVDIKYQFLVDYIAKKNIELCTNKRNNCSHMHKKFEEGSICGAHWDHKDGMRKTETQDARALVKRSVEK